MRSAGSPDVEVVEQSELRASFRLDGCEFMADVADALSDARVDHRLEADGSISYRSEDGATVQRIGDEVMKTRLKRDGNLATPDCDADDGE